jgi:hypothetical protein
VAAIDNVIRHIRSHGLHLLRRPNITLADLDKTPVFRQYRHAALDKIPAQGVQHHIDALSFGDRLDFFGKVQHARVQYMLHANRLQESPFLVAACRTEDFRTRQLRDLNCC